MEKNSLREEIEKERWEKEREKECAATRMAGWQTVARAHQSWVFESKQGLMDVFMGGLQLCGSAGTLLKRCEMFCMVWFMESSRLSNSLSCQCSLWRQASHAPTPSLTPCLSALRLSMSVCFLYTSISPSCSFSPFISGFWTPPVPFKATVDNQLLILVLSCLYRDHFRSFTFVHHFNKF